MATFFVGQRVKVRFVRYRATDGWEAGAEARITAIGNFHPDGGKCDCVVVGSFGDAYPMFNQLEPILPDGHRAGDYSLSDLLDRCRAGEGVAA